MWRFKTEEEIRAEGRWVDKAPHGWNGRGEMNKYLGQPVPQDKIPYCEKGMGFDFRDTGGDSWVFNAWNYKKDESSSATKIPWPVQGKCQTVDPRVEQFLMKKFGKSKYKTTRAQATGVAWDAGTYWWVMGYNKSAKPSYSLGQLAHHFFGDESTTAVGTPSIPNKWSIKVTRENKVTLGKWRRDASLPVSAIGGYLLSMFNDARGWHSSDYKSEYPEITFEQFKEHVLGERPTACVEVSYELLKIGQKVNLQGLSYEVHGYYLNNLGGDNSKIFSQLGLNKREFTGKVLGYECGGDFPDVKTMEDLSKLVQALRVEIAIKEGKSVAVQNLERLTKFEKDVWYYIKCLSIEYWVKCDHSASSNHIYASEYIATHKYSKCSGGLHFESDSIVRLATQEELAKYLPVGHKDLVTTPDAPEPRQFTAHEISEATRSEATKTKPGKTGLGDSHDSIIKMTLSEIESLSQLGTLMDGCATRRSAVMGYDSCDNISTKSKGKETYISDAKCMSWEEQIAEIRKAQEYAEEVAFTETFKAWQSHPVEERNLKLIGSRKR